MMNPRPIPHKENNHIPPTSDSFNPAGQWESATTNAAIHGCSCLWCSAIRHNDPPARGIVEHQERWPPGDTVTPYVKQTLLGENTADIGATVNGQTQALFVVPQAPLNQENVGEASTTGGSANPLQAQASARLDQGQRFDLAVSESLRHFAGRYINNPEALINTVRLEPSTSGRFRVVIVIEIANIL